MRLGLAYLVVVLGVSGAWATFFPQDFWNNYPGFGIRLVERLPPYNEHLVNDFGTLYLGFAALFAFALARPVVTLVRASLVAFLVYSIPHFVFHVIHLEPYPPLDAAALVVLVGSLVVVPAVLLALTRRARHAL